MAHKFEHISTGAGFKVLNDGTESTVIAQSGETIALVAGTTQPTAVGQMTYVSGVGYRLQDDSGIFTVPRTGGGGGGATLDSAYENGPNVQIDAGATTWTDANAGALNGFELVKSGAGSGNLLDLSVDATATGSAIAIDLNTGVGEKGIFIDGGGGARTADLLDIKHDGSGNNNALTITATSTGSGSLIDLLCNADGAEDGCISIDMNTAVSAEAIAIDAGGGARDANLIEIKNDGSGNVDAISIVDTNSGTGAVVDINMDANGAGSVFDVDMNAALGEEFLILDAGNKTRTANLFEITNDGAGNVDLFAITDSNTGSGAIFDIDMDGIGGGSVFDVDMNAAVGEEFLLLDSSAGIRTANLIDITYEGSGAVDCFAISANDTSSGHIFDINMAGIHTGNVFDIDLDAAVGALALSIDGGAATRTVAMIFAKHDGDGDVGVLDIDVTNTGSGHVIDIAYGNQINTGDALHIDFVGAAASTGNGLYVDTGTNIAGHAISILTAGARTSPVILINGAGTDAGTDDHIIDINQSGQLDSNVLDITYSSGASTGNAIDLNMGTAVAGGAINIDLTGVRSAPAIVIGGNMTDAGTDDHIFDISFTGKVDSNIIDIEYESGASTGDAIKVVMGTAVTGTAINLTGTGVRTDDLIQIDSDHTGAGLVFDINLSGASSGNCFDITYSTGANTGNAIDLNMGTNVAGNALDIGSAATGVDNKGSAINIAHTGNLVQGGTVIRVDSTGNYANADGNMVELIQRTGAGQTGNNVLYISGTGTNVEALKVDDGDVVFDEDFTIGGAQKGKVIRSGITTTSTAGAIAVTGTSHEITTDGANAMTLINGTQGQRLSIVYVAENAGGDVATLTPTTFAGGSTITFNDLGDSAYLEYHTTGGWFMMGGTAAVA